MLAYAAGRQRIVERRSSPSAMLLIIGGHVAAVAIVMSLKMAVDRRDGARPTQIIWVEPDHIPPPPPPEPQPQQDSSRPKSDLFVPNPPIAALPLPSPDLGTTTDPVPPTGVIIGRDPPEPAILLPIPAPPAMPVRVAARLATPASALRPPYPSSKLDSQEEAALKLRLSIDERGHVVAVDPVGAADGAFLASARRHLIARWRYRPATVGGKPVASSAVITLRFELEG